MSKPAASLWSVSTSNRKTGPIPTQWVGATRAETWASCDGCSLRPDGPIGGCYAWGGNTVRGAYSVRKAVANGKAADLATVLERTPRGAKCARLGAIGDPSRVDRKELLRDVKRLRKEGLKVLGYTHHSPKERKNSALKRHVLASCETIEQAVRAIKDGWLVALAGPKSHPGFITCTNYRKPEITCNVCGLCDVPTLKKTGKLGVVFPAHGRGAKRLPLA